MWLALPSYVLLIGTLA